jgi:Flp pilus assembly protein TadD
VEFDDPAPEAIDAAARLTQRFAVAPWYSVFDRGRSKTRSSGLFSHREVGRAAFKLPVRLEGPDGDVFCSTRDLSIKAMRCILASDLPEGTRVRAEVHGPLGSFFAWVLVREVRDITGPPHRVREFVLEFDNFEAQGRSMLQSLLELEDEPSARRDLVVEHQENHRPLVRPMAAATFAVLALAPVAVGIFQQVHDDDLLLVRSMENGSLDPASLAGTDLDRILVETLSSDRPEEQRLILLKEALEQRGRHDELVRVCRLLTSYRPEDPDMGMALVAALTEAGRYDESADLAQRWLASLDALGNTRAFEEFEVLAARNLMRSGDTYGAMDAFRRIVAARPEALDVRREYAGILLQLGLADEALRQYSVLPQDGQTLRQLVAIHSARQDFEKAELLVRSLLREEPADIGLQMDLANLLTWQGEFASAVRILRELHTTDPANAEISITLGEALTWSGEGDEALLLFGRLLDRGLDGPRLLGGFLDAYLGAESPSSSDAHRLQWMLQRRATGTPLTGELAGRLAMALVRSGSPEEAIALLEETVAANPDDRELRLRLADALVAAGENERAHHHYRSLLSGAQSKR